MSKKYTLIIIYDNDEERVLMKRAAKEPFKGKYNVLGGKIEPSEYPLMSAYREMEEESGYTEADVKLKPMMNYHWQPLDTDMYVFYGTVNKRKSYVKENKEDDYIWMSVSADFFIEELFAGYGNIGHMIRLLKAWKEEGLI